MGEGGANIFRGPVSNGSSTLKGAIDNLFTMKMDFKDALPPNISSRAREAMAREYIENLKRENMVRHLCSFYSENISGSMTWDILKRKMNTLKEEFIRAYGEDFRGDVTHYTDIFMAELCPNMRKS